jgi:hypothetical protein
MSKMGWLKRVFFPAKTQSSKDCITTLCYSHYAIFALCGLKIRFGILCCFAPLREKIYFSVNPNTYQAYYLRAYPYALTGSVAYFLFLPVELP